MSSLELPAEESRPFPGQEIWIEIAPLLAAGFQARLPFEDRWSFQHSQLVGL